MGSEIPKPSPSSEAVSVDPGLRETWMERQERNETLPVSVLHKGMSQADLDTFLNGKGYFKQQDLTDSLVKDANLYTTNKKLYKVGNMVYLNISCANISGTDIPANTKLFTLPSGAYNANADMNFAIEGGVCHINTSGELTINRSIVNSGRADIYICFNV